MERSDINVSNNVVDLNGHVREKTIQKLILFFGRDLQFLVGKSWLDLGCGSDSSPDHFEPHACRLLQEFGVKVTGIDLASNEGEPFENFRADLTDPHALDMLVGRRFDFMNHHALMFPGGGMESPTLGNMIGGKIGERRLEMQMLLWAKELLEPNGLYFQEWHVWHKNGEGLKKLSAIEQIRIASSIRDTASRLR